MINIAQLLHVENYGVVHITVYQSCLTISKATTPNALLLCRKQMCSLNINDIKVALQLEV